MSTKELWLARSESGLVSVHVDEPNYREAMNMWIDGSGHRAAYLLFSESKVLGLPTIRKGTKKKIKLTMEVL